MMATVYHFIINYANINSIMSLPSSFMAGDDFDREVDSSAVLPLWKDVATLLEDDIDTMAKERLTTQI